VLDIKRAQQLQAVVVCLESQDAVGTQMLGRARNFRPIGALETRWISGRYLHKPRSLTFSPFFIGTHQQNNQVTTAQTSDAPEVRISLRISAPASSLPCPPPVRLAGEQVPVKRRQIVPAVELERAQDDNDFISLHSFGRACRCAENMQGNRALRRSGPAAFNGPVTAFLDPVVLTDRPG